MNEVIPFDTRFGVHTCDEPCHARSLCFAKKNARTLEEMVSAGERLDDALGMGPTPCQMAGFIGEMP